MSTTRLLALCSLFMGLGAALAHAQSAPPDGAPGAPPDSALLRFLNNLSTSTDRFFGMSAAPPDTAGLDSSLSYNLANARTRARGWREALDFRARPDFFFNRADGPVWGAAATIGRTRVRGEFLGELGYAAGSEDWLGRGRYTKIFGTREPYWFVRLVAGRETESMDRERTSFRLASIRALIFGSDSRNYYRREGFELTWRRETAEWRAGMSYRDMLETPLATTTTWNLRNNELSTVENLQATRGRAREIEAGGAARVPPTPIVVELIHQVSGSVLGSDFDYRRTRGVIGADIGLGSWASLLPQFVYGRLTGTSIPQAAFYLGGSRSLRSIHSASRGGTGYAFARIELIGTRDILKALRIPHPSAFPVQLGGFVGAGAVWGQDPLGGPTRPGVNWPNEEDWASEVGLAALYQPGFPDRTGLVRFNYTWPLGPSIEQTRLTVAYSRAMDLLRPFAR